MANSTRSRRRAAAVLSAALAAGGLACGQATVCAQTAVMALDLPAQPLD